MGLILRCVTAPYRGLITSGLTTRNAWIAGWGFAIGNNLSFASSNMIKDFTNFEMQAKETMEAYYVRFGTLLEELSSVNQTRTPEETTLRFCEGLSSAYQPVKDAYTQNGTDKTLMMYYQMGQRVENGPDFKKTVALLARASAPLQAPAPDAPARPQCRYCGNHGHLKPVCRSHASDMANGTVHPDKAPHAGKRKFKGKGKFQPRGAHQAATVMALTSLALLLPLSAAFTIVQDSGSVHHITRDFNALSDVTTCAPVNVTYGNGAQTSITTCGALTFTTDLGTTLVLSKRRPCGDHAARPPDRPHVLQLHCGAPKL